MNRNATHTFLLLLSILVIAGTAGCGTVGLGSLKTCQEAHVGYWAARATGNESLRETYASRLAESELEKRRLATLPETLHELRAYKASLKKPVIVSTSYSADAPDLETLPQSEIQKLDKYVVANRESAGFSGTLHSSAWADELVRIAPEMEKLQDRVANILGNAEGLLRAGNHAGALEVWQQAAKLDRDGAMVIAKEKKIRVQLAKKRIPALISSNNSLLEKAGVIQKNYFGANRSTDANLKRCTALVDQARKANAAFRTDLRLSNGGHASEPQLDDALKKAETAVARMLGRCWSEQLRLMAQKKLFWSAYEYADARFKETAGLSGHRMAGLNDELQKAYARLIAPAAAHYVQEANRHFDQDAYGVALVFCRMAEEIVEYGKLRNVPLTTAALTWEKRCWESRIDTQKKIAPEMERRVIIGEFTPKSPQNETLASTVYAKCVRQLSEAAKDGSKVAWGARVEKLNDRTRTTQGDYLVGCNIAELHVMDLVPEEIQRSVVKVGREINEVPNPRYHQKNNPDVPKTVFSQEVYHYQKITLRHHRKAKLKMSATCAHASRKTSLLMVDTDFSSKNRQLKDAIMTCVEERLDVPFVGPPKIAPSRGELSFDSWPKAVPAKMSSEIEIKTQVRSFVADAVVDRTVALVSSYPVAHLAAAAIQQQKLGNAYEAADSWGRCIEYCFRLVITRDTQKEGWLAQKNRMLKHISVLCATVWKDEDQAILSRMQDVWSAAISSALKVPVKK